MKYPLLALAGGVALLMGGCVNTTPIQHADGTWTVVTRNPALLDGNVVMTTRYAAGEEPLVMMSEPEVAIGPSILGQLAMPVAYVWGKHEEKRGLRDSGDNVSATATGGSAETGDAVAESGVDINIDVENSGTPKKVWN
jgi:hypothetical protein